MGEALTAQNVTESNHARYECKCGRVVKTLQRDGKGPAFFPRKCECGRLVKP